MNTPVIMFMNTFSGIVQTMEEWIEESKKWEDGSFQDQLDSLVDVVEDGNGGWRVR